jgi:TatD DNase family protein
VLTGSLGDTLIMRVRKRLRQEYGYPEGKQTNSLGLKIDKKWNIIVAHSLPTGTGRRSDNPGQGSRKCDAVYGNTCFSTGTIGFALASVVVNAIATGEYLIPKRLGMNAKQKSDESIGPPQYSQVMDSSDSTIIKLDCNETSSLLTLVNNGSCCDDVSRSPTRAVPSSASIAVMDEELKTLTVQFFDAHCHLQLHPNWTSAGLNGLDSLINTAKAVGLMRVSVCGICPGQDWEDVKEIYSHNPSFIIPNFGLHPWRIAKYNNESGYQASEGKWLDQLRVLLDEYPTAGVGECGLDKAIKKEVSVEEQGCILQHHIQIAAAYNRTLTIHCVAMWGMLLDIVSSSKANLIIPKCYILHSCNSMPADLVRAFLNIGEVYFSLSAGRYDNPKFRRLVSTIPLDRLLIETDSPDQMSAALRTVGIDKNEPANIRYECLQLARLLGISTNELAAVTVANAIRAYSYS